MLSKGTAKKVTIYSRDLPMMIAVVETDEKMSLAAEAVEEMLQDGLIVVSEVDMVRLIHPHSLSDTKPEAANAKLSAG